VTVYLPSLEVAQAVLGEVDSTARDELLAGRAALEAAIERRRRRA
jgi:hypothetical protein